MPTRNRSSGHGSRRPTSDPGTVRCPHSAIDHGTVEIQTLPPSALPGQRERTLALTFSIVTVGCWLIAALGGGVNWPLYVGSVGSLVLVGVLVFARRYRIGGRELSDLPWALAYLAATGLLRAASPGESALALIPVVCIALTGSSWVELAGAIVATAAACIVPAVVGHTTVPFTSLRGPLEIGRAHV